MTLKTFVESAVSPEPTRWPYTLGAVFIGRGSSFPKLITFIKNANKRKPGEHMRSYLKTNVTMCFAESAAEFGHD